MEAGFLAQLRAIVTHPAARGLLDDAAVLDWPIGLQLVATHDMLAEGVHFTPDCPPSDVAWKLVAVNLSDLAAMGARPVALLLGTAFGPRQDAAWRQAFAAGLARVTGEMAVPLIGGDTIRTSATAHFSVTALGSVPAGAALARSGASAGDDLWVSGTIGDAGLGLQAARGQGPADVADRKFLLARYRRPNPRIALGLALRGVASAAMDVSDGLALDASRLAQASGCLAMVQLADLPLSAAARRRVGGAGDAALAAIATMGDDYELLFTSPPAQREAVAAAAAASRTAVTRIGQLLPAHPGRKMIVLVGASGVSVPIGSLGYEHQ